MTTTARPSLVSTLTPEARAWVDGHLVVEVGFGAGPAFAAGMIRRLDRPVTVEQALALLEPYRGQFRRAHVELDDGSRLLFEPGGFLALRTPAWS